MFSVKAFKRPYLQIRTLFLFLFFLWGWRLEFHLLLFFLVSFDSSQLFLYSPSLFLHLLSVLLIMEGKLTAKMDTNKYYHFRNFREFVTTSFSLEGLRRQISTCLCDPSLFGSLFNRHSFTLKLCFL